MTSTLNACKTLDQHSVARPNRGWHLERIVQTPIGHKVRLVVHRDFYEQQSFADASVLSADLSWTDLVTADASTWHATGDHPQQVCENVAAALLGRALAVLA